MGLRNVPAAVFAFFIGLGLGPLLHWVAEAMKVRYWSDAVLFAAKLAIVGYIVYLGLQQLLKVYDEWGAFKAKGAVEQKFNGMARAYVAFAYLLVAFLLVMVMF